LKYLTNNNGDDNNDDNNGIHLCSYCTRSNYKCSMMTMIGFQSRMLLIILFLTDKVLDNVGPWDSLEFVVCDCLFL